MSKCFRKEIKNYGSGIFDSFIDMTYVMTMENAKERHQQIKDQLEYFKLTKKATFIYNTGFKKCDKIYCTPKKCEKINDTFVDLLHAIHNIHDDALNNGYNNILLLQDDAVISKEILEPEVAENLDKLVKDYKNKPLLLKLGVIPVITSYYNNHFRKVLLSGGAHAIIYNKIGMNKMKYSKTESRDDETKQHIVFSNKQLMYKKPLISQIYEETDNSKTWGARVNFENVILKSTVQKFSNFIIKFFLRSFKLNSHIEPGTTFLYKYHNYISASIILTIITLAYYIFRLFFRTISSFIPIKKIKRLF